MRSLTAMLEESENRQESSQSAVRELAAQIQATERALNAARADAATASVSTTRRVEAAKTETAQVAQEYSRKIDNLERDRQRDAAIQRARAQQKENVVPEAQLRAAKPFVQTWKTTWETAVIADHIRYYSPTADGARITVDNGKESRQYWSHDQLMTQVRQSSPAEWSLLRESSVYGEGGSVVAEAAYRRKAASASNTFEFWVRKSYWSETSGSWRVAREEWRYYRDVPSFPGNR
ncbi:MAG: hypothetical protein O3A46_13980 [Candidatus Poribacteria bacterium]|nr:hypothetical protein [Candidatus Poribacteria bacterium]